MQISAESQKQLKRFLVTGFSSVAIDCITYFVALKCGLAREPSKAIGYISGMLVGFVLNKTWTFRSHGKIGTEILTYFFLYCVTFFANLAVNYAVVRFFNDISNERAVLIMAFFSATFVSTVLNFLGMRFITFKKGIAARESLAPNIQ